MTCPFFCKNYWYADSNSNCFQFCTKFKEGKILSCWCMFCGYKMAWEKQESLEVVVCPRCGNEMFCERLK